MGTVAEFTVPADTFGLAETLAVTPTPRVEIEPSVPLPSAPRAVLLWITAADFETVERALASDPSVVDAHLVTSSESIEERLYCARWTDGAVTGLPLLETTESTTLGAHTREDRWAVRMFFDERAVAAAAYEDCRAAGRGVHLEWIRDVGEGRRLGGSDLTAAQYRALVTAYRRGYYEIPRRVDLETLAASLNISHQALSERLCRGHRNLIRTMLEETDVGVPAGLLS